MQRRLVPLFLLLGSLSAQDRTAVDLAEGAPFPPRSVFGSTAGLQREDGRLLGVGPDYKVWLDRDGFTFVPALGRRAPRDLPLRFRITEMGRLSGATPVKPVAPVMEERTAVFRRGIWEERYEMRPEGMEQSFLFHSLPPGTGDLFVRGLVDSDLHASIEAGGGARFALPGVGGVDIGAVTGIDADGVRAHGSLRLEGDTPELSLPAEFVEGARLPLLLDPLIGTNRAVSGSVGDQACDVAYDHGNDCYLVAWEVFFSTRNIDVHATLVNPDGSPCSGLLALETGSSPGTFPAAANVAATDAFAVVWQSRVSGNLFGRAVGARTGSLSAIATIRSTTATIRGFDVGGEATQADDDAIVVWSEGRNILAKQVRVSPRTMTPFSTVVGVGNTSDDDTFPTISRSGGGSGRHCIAWKRRVGTRLPAIRAAIVTRNLGIHDGFIPLTGTSVSHTGAHVDGDGDRWVVAYSKAESTASVPDRDVFCRTVEYVPSNPAGNRGRAGGAEVPVENDPGDHERAGGVAWIGDSVLVVYADQDGGAATVYVKSIDPFDSSVCEGEFRVHRTGILSTPFMAVASQRSGAAATSREQALLVWNADPSGTQSDVFVRPFDAVDGDLDTSIGGGCGQGGTPRASCAREGNAGFDLRLLEARASALAFAVAGVRRSPSRRRTCPPPRPATAWSSRGARRAWS